MFKTKEKKRIGRANIDVLAKELEELSKHTAVSLDDAYSKSLRAPPLFSNEFNRHKAYNKIAKASKNFEKEALPSKKLKAAVLIGESNVLHFLPEIKKQADIIIFLDINPMVLTSIEQQILAFSKSENYNDFLINLFDKKNKTFKYKIPLFNTDTRKLGLENFEPEHMEQFYFGSLKRVEPEFNLKSRYDLCKDLYKNSKFLYLNADFFNLKHISKFANILQKNDVEISLLNVSNLHNYSANWPLSDFPAAAIGKEGIFSKEVRTRPWKKDSRFENSMKVLSSVFNNKVFIMSSHWYNCDSFYQMGNNGFRKSPKLFCDASLSLKDFNIRTQREENRISRVCKLVKANKIPFLEDICEIDIHQFKDKTGTEKVVKEIEARLLGKVTPMSREMECQINHFLEKLKTLNKEDLVKKASEAGFGKLLLKKKNKKLAKEMQQAAKPLLTHFKELKENNKKELMELNAEIYKNADKGNYLLVSEISLKAKSVKESYSREISEIRKNVREVTSKALI